ncbi:hypothetical protein ACK1KB_13650 [Chryseobacterium sp. TY3]
MAKIRNLIIQFLILLFISCTISCKYKNNAKIKQFVGDSLISTKLYFTILTTKKTSQLLENQNNLYIKNFSKFKSTTISTSTDLNIKLIKANTPNEKDLKINLYTYLKDKKVDSIQFYRNLSGGKFGHFNTLSYFNSKKNKFWQIQYFPTNPLRGNTPGIISYTEKSITQEGLITTDSIHYLDESLQAVLDENNLY